MANRLKGITLEIGGDTTSLSKSLSGVNSEIKNTQSQLKDVEKLLKMDPKNVELLKQKQKLLTDAIKETKTKLDELKNAQETMDANGVDKNSEQYQALRREIIDTNEQLHNLYTEAAESNTALTKLGQVSESVAGGMNKVASATKGVSTAAAALIGAAATSSVNFEDSFAKVSTLLDKSKTDFDAYKDSIIQGSNETGIAAGEFAEAVYSAISAGQDQANAVQFVTDANKLAQGGFTSLTSSVDVLTTVMNAYGSSAGSATKVSDILIATQNEGKTTVDELASALGAVIPVAASAGESFSDVGADMALLTKNGIATSESATYLKSMLSELSKTGSTTDLALREMTGKGFAELKESGKSTADILKLLDEYAEKNNLTLKDMFSSVEAGSAALTLFKNDGADLTAELQAMASAGGSASEAFETVTETTGHRLKEAANSLKNTLIELGDTMAPVIEQIVSVLEQVIEYISGMDSKTLQIIATILAVVAAISPVASLIAGIASAVSALIPVVVAINAAIMANPVVAICTAAGIAIAALVYLIIKYWDEIEAACQALWEGLKRGFNAVKEAILNIFRTIANGIISLIENAINNVIARINSVISMINSVASSVSSLLGVSYGGISSVKSVKLKKFATGGSITSGAALVGEAGPELLTVSGGRATVTPLTATLDSKSLSALNGGAQQTNVSIQFTGSLSQLAAVLQPKIAAETTRRGTSLVRA